MDIFNSVVKECTGVRTRLAMRVKVKGMLWSVWLYKGLKLVLKKYPEQE